MLLLKLYKLLVLKWSTFNRLKCESAVYIPRYRGLWSTFRSMKCREYEKSSRTMLDLGVFPQEYHRVLIKGELECFHTISIMKLLVELYGNEDDGNEFDGKCSETKNEVPLSCFFCVH